ncbi:MAG: hypothetical protein LBB14_01800 [Puniceicoccales bacterium]|jgi:hypothetical protein|nr:hypothetical protein [Puniceicoccales bacterium]
MDRLSGSPASAIYDPRNLFAEGERPRGVAMAGWFSDNSCDIQDEIPLLRQSGDRGAAIDLAGKGADGARPASPPFGEDSVAEKRKMATR